MKKIIDVFLFFFYSKSSLDIISSNEDDVTDWWFGYGFVLCNKNKEKLFSIKNKKNFNINISKKVKVDYFSL